MSTVKNLWGELPLAESIRTPASMLREQATKLTELTNGLLQGEIASGRSANKKLFYRLNIVAPLLDNYSYSVLYVNHDVIIYPLDMVDEASGKTYSCKDEEDFLTDVAEILSSDTVHKAISALVAQSRSDIPPGL